MTILLAQPSLGFGANAVVIAPHALRKMARRELIDMKIAPPIIKSVKKEESEVISGVNVIDLASISFLEAISRRPGGDEKSVGVEVYPGGHGMPSSISTSGSSVVAVDVGSAGLAFSVISGCWRIVSISGRI